MRIGKSRDSSSTLKMAVQEEAALYEELEPVSVAGGERFMDTATKINTI